MPVDNFIPGMRFRILTPLYDTFLHVMMNEVNLKSLLINQANPKDNEKILDFGCGTGTLALMIKRTRPGCDVYGIDIDPQMLEIAARKVQHEGVDVHLVHYNGITMQFTDESFDKVVTSLVLHHLSNEEKLRILREIYRVLKKGGELHILDFGIQKSPYTRFITFFLKYLEPIEDNILGKIPEFLIMSGFNHVEERDYRNTWVGTVSFYSSRK